MNNVHVQLNAADPIIYSVPRGTFVLHSESTSVTVVLPPNDYELIDTCQSIAETLSAFVVDARRRLAHQEGHDHPDTERFRTGCPVCEREHSISESHDVSRTIGL